MIRKITARTRKIMISHFPIVYAILPIKPRIIKITAMRQIVFQAIIASLT